MKKIAEIKILPILPGFKIEERKEPIKLSEKAKKAIKKANRARARMWARARDIFWG